MGFPIGRLRRMKSAFVAALLVMLSMAVPGARADDPPKLSNPIPIEHTVTVGTTLQFTIDCKLGSDVLIAAGVEFRNPQGETIVKPPVGSLADIHDHFTVDFTPTDAGEYQYHFFAQDANGKSTYPDRAELQFNVQPNWFPWAIIGGGFVLSFLIISTLVYNIMHRAFGASQTSAARVAIMFGAISWMFCILYAENWLNNVIAWVIGGVAILLLLVWAFIAK